MKYRESGTTLSNIGDLPPIDSPRPTSSTNPSLSRTPTISETVVRVRRVRRATSARLTGSWAKMVLRTRSRLCCLVC
jgi:hypothetical protein